MMSAKNLDGYLKQLKKQVEAAHKEIAHKEEYISLVEQTAVGLKRAYREFSTAYELSKLIVSTQSLEKINKLLVGAIEEVTPFVACALLLREPFSDDFYIRFRKSLTNELEKRIKFHQDNGYYDWVFREKRAIILPEEEAIDDQPPTSILVPLWGSTEALGMLEIFLPTRAEEFTQREFDLFSLLANQAAIAIENARLYRDMELKTEAIASIKNYMTSILENMADGLIAIDRDQRVTLFNHSAEELFGITSTEAMGNSLKDIFTNRVAEFFDGIFQETLEKAQGVERELNCGEKTLPVGVRTSLLKGDSDSVTGVILVCRDLSETKELISLRKLDQLKDQFISSVSHELRTPLTAIKSFSEILLNYEEDQETQREFLTIIDNESDRLSRIINNMLDLSKIKSGMMDWKIEEFNIHEVLSVAIDTVQPLAVEKDHQINYNDKIELPPIRADRDKLTQVVINLLSNAIKFTPEGGKIKAETELIQGKRKTDPSNFVKVGISDTGIGIAPENLEVIFEKFRQVGDTLTDKPKGTGLGLPISKQIVEFFGGEIWAKSQPGKGSIFYFTLPVASVE